MDNDNLRCNMPTSCIMLPEANEGENKLRSSYAKRYYFNVLKTTPSHAIQKLGCSGVLNVLQVTKNMSVFQCL